MNHETAWAISPVRRQPYGLVAALRRAVEGMASYFGSGERFKENAENSPGKLVSRLETA